MCEPRASDWGGSHAGPSGGTGGSGVTLKPEQCSRQECAGHVGWGWGRPCFSCSLGRAEDGKAASSFAATAPHRSASIVHALGLPDLPFCSGTFWWDGDSTGSCSLCV